MSHSPPVIDGLRFVRSLGDGGLSFSYLYRQLRPDREVVVQVPWLDGGGASGDAAVEAFLAEAAVLAHVSEHPNIVSIYFADVDEKGRPYVGMEYCPGDGISEHFRHARMLLPTVFDTCFKLAGAIASSHMAGLLHGHVNPRNILLDGAGTPKLTGWRIGDSSPWASGIYLPWAPPEAFWDSPPRDVRTDVYGLAATTYGLISGRSPYEETGVDNDMASLLFRIENRSLPRLERRSVPDGLYEVLVKGMAKDLDERYDSVVEFAEALLDAQSANEGERGRAKPTAAPSELKAPLVRRVPDQARQEDFVFADFTPLAGGYNKHEVRGFLDRLARMVRDGSPTHEVAGSIARGLATTDTEGFSPEEVDGFLNDLLVGLSSDDDRGRSRPFEPDAYGLAGEWAQLVLIPSATASRPGLVEAARIEIEQIPVHEEIIASMNSEGIVVAHFTRCATGGYDIAQVDAFLQHVASQVRRSAFSDGFAFDLRQQIPLAGRVGYDPYEVEHFIHDLVAGLSRQVAPGRLLSGAEQYRTANAWMMQVLTPESLERGRVELSAARSSGSELSSAPPSPQSRTQPKPRAAKRAVPRQPTPPSALARPASSRRASAGASRSSKAVPQAPARRNRARPVVAGPVDGIGAKVGAVVGSFVQEVLVDLWDSFRALPRVIGHMLIEALIGGALFLIAAAVYFFINPTLGVIVLVVFSIWWWFRYGANWL